MLYRIPKDAHNAFRLPHLFFGRRLWRWRIVLGAGVWTGKAPDHVSKIIGVGFWPGHHEESVRLGWMERPEPGAFDLYLYWYEGGIRASKLLRSIREGQPVEFRVERVGARAMAALHNGGTEWIVCPVNTAWSWLSYLLRPYYGGGTVAPNEMQILVEDQ